MSFVFLFCLRVSQLLSLLAVPFTLHGLPETIALLLIGLPALVFELLWKQRVIAAQSSVYVLVCGFMGLTILLVAALESRWPLAWGFSLLLAQVIDYRLLRPELSVKKTC